MSERESCYSCDYFYEKSEMYLMQLEDLTVMICPECAGIVIEGESK